MRRARYWGAAQVLPRLSGAGEEAAVTAGCPVEEGLVAEGEAKAAAGWGRWSGWVDGLTVIGL